MGVRGDLNLTGRTDDSLMLSPASYLTDTVTPRSAAWPSPSPTSEKAWQTSPGSATKSPRAGKPKRQSDFITPNFMFNISRQVNSILDDAPALKDVLGTPTPRSKNQTANEFPAFQFEPDNRTPRTPLAETTPSPSRSAMSRKPTNQFSDNVLGASVHTLIAADGMHEEDNDLDWDDESDSEVYDADSRPQAAWEHGAEMVQQAKQFLRPEVVDKVRTCLKSAALDGMKGFNIERFYRKIDTDRSGALDYGEMRQAVRKQLKLGPRDISNDEINDLCRVLDTDQSGEIPVECLFDFAVERQEYVRTQQAMHQQHLKKEIGEARKWRKEALKACKENRADVLMQAELDAAGVKVEELERHLAELQNEDLTPARKVKAKGKKCNELDAWALDKVRTKIRAAAYTPSGGYNVDLLFQKLDKDGSGEISYEELRQGLRSACRVSPFEMSDAQLSTLFISLDSDGSGEVDVREIFSFAIAEYQSRHERKEQAAGQNELIKKGVALENKASEIAAEQRKRKELMKAQNKLPDSLKDKVQAFISSLKYKFGTLREAYKQLDPEEEGRLTYNMLRTGLEQYEVPWKEATSSNDLRAIFKALDSCGSRRSRC